MYMVSKWNATSVHEPTIQPKDIFYISINTPSVSIGTDMSLMMICVQVNINIKTIFFTAQITYINLGYILNTYNAFEFGTHRWRKKISPNCDRAFYDRRRKQINPDNLTRISNFGKRNLGPTSRGKALE
jgi:hypothetical protein